MQPRWAIGLWLSPHTVVWQELAEMQPAWSWSRQKGSQHGLRVSGWYRGVEQGAGAGGWCWGVELGGGAGGWCRGGWTCELPVWEHQGRKLTWEHGPDVVGGRWRRAQRCWGPPEPELSLSEAGDGLPGARLHPVAACHAAPRPGAQPPVRVPALALLLGCDAHPPRQPPRAPRVVGPVPSPDTGSRVRRESQVASHKSQVTNHKSREGDGVVWPRPQPWGEGGGQGAGEGTDSWHISTLA